MISITERLRARHEPVGDGTGTWRPDGLCQEAAEVIDDLVAAVEGMKLMCSVGENPFDHEHGAFMGSVDAALSKAKGKQE